MKIGYSKLDSAFKEELLARKQLREIERKETKQEL